MESLHRPFEHHPGLGCISAMGKSVAVHFVVRNIVVDRCIWTDCCWNSKYAGRPTEANLARWVEATEKSCLPGGVNEHIKPTRILSAEIYDQFKGEVRATYKAK